MARGAAGTSDPAVFFFATLLLWLVSVVFEIAFNSRRELLAVIVGFLFYQTANFLVRAALSRDPLFVNTCVSLLHAAVTSSSVILVLVNEWNSSNLSKMIEHSQLVSGNWFGSYTALCFSCGYFAYDQLDMLRYQYYTGWIPNILVHHLIFLVCFTLALFQNITISYLVLTLLCELHSIFLHVRKVRRMAWVRDVKSKIVRVEWAWNWLTFIFARVDCQILITYKLLIDASKFEKGVDLPLALFDMVGMNLLDVFLGLAIKLIGEEKICRSLMNENAH